jgi:hypothetical protein
MFKTGECKYDGHKGYYRPVAPLTLSDFLIFRTKKEGTSAASKLSFPQNHVQKLGSNFQKCWGIRYDFRDDTFLLK